MKRIQTRGRRHIGLNDHENEHEDALGEVEDRENLHILLRGELETGYMGGRYDLLYGFLGLALGGEC